MSVVMEAAFERGIASPKRDLRVQGYGNREGRGVESIPHYCTRPPDRWAVRRVLWAAAADLGRTPFGREAIRPQIARWQDGELIQKSPMPFGSGALRPVTFNPLTTSRLMVGHQCLSAAGPFGPFRNRRKSISGYQVTNAFRQRGPSAPDEYEVVIEQVQGESPMPFGSGALRPKAQDNDSSCY